MVKVWQLVNDRNNCAANQFVIKTNDGTYFQSYDSVVAFLNNKEDKVYLGKDWDYSRTTLKHLYIFLRDYADYSVHSKDDIKTYSDMGKIVMPTENSDFVLG